MNNNSKEYLEKLINDLCKEGEDKDELTLWLNLYDALTEDERTALIDNLEKELQQLKNLK
ncbi:MAG: hypothetical protein WC783_02565 [Candidatus Paceibacterota bacterium]|jgi:hypothetical protein